MPGVGFEPTHSCELQLLRLTRLASFATPAMHLSSRFSRRMSKPVTSIVLGLVVLLAFILPMNGDAASSSIVINEVQTTGGPGNTSHDFVEFLNLTNVPFNLKGHRLVKRTKTGTSDTTLKSWTADAMIPARGYYLWASSSDESFPATLKADEWTSQTIADDNGVALRFGPEDTGTVVDSVAWGEATNALVEGVTVSINPEAGESIARTNGVDTDLNDADFARRTPTPQHTGSTPLVAPGSPAAPPPAATTSSPSSAATESTAAENESANRTPAAPKSKLRISEIFPNPWGDDATEFIELMNDRDVPIDLFGWRLVNRAKQEYVLPHHTLTAKSIAFFDRRVTGLALQNERDEVRLLAPNKTRADDTVTFSDAPEGLAYIPTATDAWEWTTVPTPGAANERVPVPEPPHVTLVMPTRAPTDTILNFDGSDSFDPEKRVLSYAWDFGDGHGSATTAIATYLYANAGTYTVRLRATSTDGRFAEATKKVTITAAPAKKADDEKNASSSPPPTPPKAPAKKSPAKTTVTSTGTTTIEGVVTTPPGVIAKTFLFLRCTTACETDGVKVRMTKADWPELRVGDVLRVNGTWSDAGGERSFLTRKERISVIPGRKRVIPIELTIAELDDVYANDLVVLAGEVTEKKNTFAYLDDGAEEIRVEIPDTKVRASVGEGDTIRAIGILAKDATGWKVRATEAPTITTPATDVPDETIQIVRPRDPKTERSRAIALALAVTLGLAVKPTYDFVGKFRGKK